jgi:SGT1 protein
MSSTEEDLAWFKSTFHPIPRPALPDDCIEYSIYIISDALDTVNDSETRLRLREVQKHAAVLQKQWLTDYIWQRQGFGLEIQKEDGEVCMPKRRAIENQLTTHVGLSFLRGRTEYGDSIEDEWVVVWLLRELTKKFSDAWIKVTDNDGEFLLIEASGTLPSWLEPDVAENRVWINDGQLRIVRPKNWSKSAKRTDEKISIQEARQILLKEPKRLMHSVSMEEEAFYRLRNYPAQIKTNVHNALVVVPRKIAFLLKQKPAYVSPAIEAFYLRDPIALKKLNSKDAERTMTFPPTDLVTISARFPKVGYAQLKSQDFPAPPVFANSKISDSGSSLSSQTDVGMKMTCGFEMLLSDSHHQDKSDVREMKLLLDDLGTGDETLPSDDEIQTWPKQQDDEKWLDIDFGDLEYELGKGTDKKDSKKKREFGDKAAQENLRRIVKQFEDFLNDDKAGPDGAKLSVEDSDDDLDDANDSDEDEDGSFDEEEFSRLMQEMMGMPKEVMEEIMRGKLDGEGKAVHSEIVTKPPIAKEMEDGGELSSGESEDDMETTMARMEAELRDHGALDLGSPPFEEGKGKRAIKISGEDEDSDSSENGGGENDTDVNLARNLLASFKAQAGVSGPGGNMMGLMGLNMPKDVDETGEDGAAGPSRAKKGPRIKPKQSPSSG